VTCPLQCYTDNNQVLSKQRTPQLLDDSWRAPERRCRLPHTQAANFCANQLDLRFSKIIRMGTGGRYRTLINFDMANALNSNDGLGFNTTYGPSWQNVTNIMDGRFMKISAPFEF
jgi:hypothetical protein